MFVLQYGISGPEEPELSSHRRPVVMSRRSGGLALIGWSARVITSIKVLNRKLRTAASRHFSVNCTGKWAGECISP